VKPARQSSRREKGTKDKSVRCVKKSGTRHGGRDRVGENGPGTKKDIRLNKKKIKTNGCTGRRCAGGGDVK